MGKKIKKVIVMLDSDGHYADEFWRMSERDYQTLAGMLTGRDYYLSAAIHNDPEKAKIVETILARSKRLPAPRTILKYC